MQRIMEPIELDDYHQTEVLLLQLLHPLQRGIKTAKTLHLLY